MQVNITLSFLFCSLRLRSATLRSLSLILDHLVRDYREECDNYNDPEDEKSAAIILVVIHCTLLRGLLRLFQSKLSQQT